MQNRHPPPYNQGRGVGVVRSRRFLGGVGVRFLTILGVGVGFVVRLRMSVIGSFLHHNPELGIPVEMVQFHLKLLLNRDFFL